MSVLFTSFSGSVSAAENYTIADAIPGISGITVFSSAVWSSEGCTTDSAEFTVNTVISRDCPAYSSAGTGSA